MSSMTGFFPRSFLRLVLSTLLFTLFIIGFIYMYRTTQLHRTLPSIVNHFNPETYVCPSNKRAVNMKVLGSRPFCIHLLSHDIVSDRIATTGSWMPQQTKFISLLLDDSPSKPAVFLDIGANIGWFTVVMSVLGHQVIAIEPMESNVELMRASLQASQILHNVIVHSRGLDVTPGKCVLYSDNQNIGDGHTACGTSSEKDMSAVVPAGYSIRQVINTTRLDALVNQNIDVLKIDVEGSELHAVRSGARLFDEYDVRHIISEFSPKMIRDKKSDPYEYLKFFVSRGYNIRIVNDGMSELYKQNSWQKVHIYKSDEDLRTLSNNAGILELWFTKN